MQACHPLAQQRSHSRHLPRRKVGITSADDEVVIGFGVLGSLFVCGSRGRPFLRAYIFSAVEQQPLVREGCRPRAARLPTATMSIELGTNGRLVYWRLKMPIQILLPPTGKSGLPMCELSSAPSRLRAIRRKSSASIDALLLFQHRYRTPQACGGAYSSPAAHAGEPRAERLTAYAKVFGRAPNSGLGTGSGPLKSCFSRE